METSHTLAKEHINGLQFVKRDVLRSPQQRAIRKYQLRRACY